MDVPEGDPGEDAANAQHSHAHKALRRWTAASTIQSRWRALRIPRRDVGDAGVAELRARHKRLDSARKAVGKLTLIMARVAVLCSGVAEHARHYEAADGAWFEVRGAASIVVADVLPFVKWADNRASGGARPFPLAGHGAELDRREGDRGELGANHRGRVSSLCGSASGDVVPLDLRRCHHMGDFVRRLRSMVAQLVRAAFVAGNHVLHRKSQQSRAEAPFKDVPNDLCWCQLVGAVRHVLLPVAQPTGKDRSVDDGASNLWAHHVHGWVPRNR